MEIPGESKQAGPSSPLELALNDMASTASVRGIPSSRRLPVLVERRLRSRYPLDLGVRFRSLSRARFRSGDGRAINISSGGLLVASDHPFSEHDLEVGTRVEMRIAWPFLLNGTVPLQLLTVGRVIRRGSSSFAATFELYQFRTVKSSSQIPTSSLNGRVEPAPLY